MMTLVFPESRPNASVGPSPTVALREWLAGRWAILFSHPGDFDHEQLERDRWLNILSRSFSLHGVRPLALALHGYDARETSLGWLAELGNGRAAVLSIAAPAQGALFDLSASALRAEIARSGPRFAMIIDPALRCRRTIHYRAATDLPSPIELLGWAVALRERGRELNGGTSPCGPSRSSVQDSRARQPPFIGCGAYAQRAQRH